MRPRVLPRPNGESPTRAADCRKVLAGSGVNEPDPFPGYAGFVGWECPALLPDGELLVSFSAGYWHDSPPTPWLLSDEKRRLYRELGCPTDVDAPRGGRAMLIRSRDGGRTWSRPETLIDTAQDDRSPAICCLRDGTLVCSLFTSSSAPAAVQKERPDVATHTGILRSSDGGHTWGPLQRLPESFVYDATDGPPLELSDGVLLLPVYGSVLAEDTPRVWSQGIFRSQDNGATWALAGSISAPYELTESSIAELPDGRLVLVARSLGVISWSHDRGAAWTPPVAFGIGMVDPGLFVLRDGTLVCIYGSYAEGRRGLRAILSRDGGETWVGAGETHGFLIDDTYGYARGVELPDGSVYIAYIKSGGHRAEDARTNAVLAVRMRVRDDGVGIELLPPEF